MGPIASIGNFIRLLFLNRVRSEKHYVGSRFFINNQKYVIFRCITVRVRNAVPTSVLTSTSGPAPVVLVLRFRFHHSSIRRDRIASFFQIPLFAGIPGFQAKLWTFDETSGFFQGVYQWESLMHAEAYLNSYAVSFVRKKALRDSVSFELYKNVSLEHFMEQRLLCEGSDY